MNKKKRRHSGRITTRTSISIKPKELINKALDPQEYWSDWDDYRDGIRCCTDKTKIRSKYMWFAENHEVERYNKKNKKLVRRRKKRKQKLMHSL